MSSCPPRRPEVVHSEHLQRWRTRTRPEAGAGARSSNEVPLRARYSGTMRSEELETAVASYVGDYRRPAARDLEYLRRLRSDEDAVAEAALARLPSGKRHPHQYRIPSNALEASRNRLVRNCGFSRVPAHSMPCLSSSGRSSDRSVESASLRSTTRRSGSAPGLDLSQSAYTCIVVRVTGRRRCWASTHGATLSSARSSRRYSESSTRARSRISCVSTSIALGHQPLRAVHGLGLLSDAAELVTRRARDPCLAAGRSRGQLRPFPCAQRHPRRR
jgi:hypothetical protein